MNENLGVMAIFKTEIGSGKSIFIMSLDVEEYFVKMLKQWFLIETLQSDRTATTAISDDGTEYQCAQYSIDLSEEDKEVFMQAATQVFRKNIEKSLPKISES